MRIVPLLFLLIIVCKGDHWKYRQLIDLLRRVEETAEKRHEVTAGKRHEVTEGKRHEVTADKRHEVTEGKRYEVTEGKRHEYTTPKRHEFREWTTESSQPKANIVPSTIKPNLAEIEFLDIEEAFLFPGSHYLIDTIRKHCESGMALNMPIENIRDQFEFPVCEAKDLRRMLLVLKQVEDPQGVALLVTRTLIKPLLMERMKCPAAILEMGIVKRFLQQKDYFMGKEDQFMMTFAFFFEMIPLIDPKLERYTKDLTSYILQELHVAIFGETMESLLKYGLKDLAIASHKIFHHLHSFFDDVVRDMAYSERESEMLQHLQSASSDIKCPSSLEFRIYHAQELVKFQSQFWLNGTESYCAKVVDSIMKYANMTIRGYQPHFDNTAVFSSLCEGIQPIFDEIFKGYRYYEDFLYRMQQNVQLGKLLDGAMSDEEMMLLEEALKRLKETS